MAEERTTKLPRVSERQKAGARVLLLTGITLVCSPIAGVRSSLLWGLYALFALLYSAWALRLTRRYSHDRYLGYLLCFTDVAVLVPLLVWSSPAIMKALLLLVCGAGLAVSVWAGRTSSYATGCASRSLSLVDDSGTSGTPDGRSMETPLERALRVRLFVLKDTETRFAVVVLRIVGFEEMATAHGEEASSGLLARVGRQGLSLLGSDAQRFVLPGGRVAFVFATGAEAADAGAGGIVRRNALERINPYDIESLAMSLGRKSCEGFIDGQEVECVVGWASAPADGVTPDDLMYAAENGAQSTAAYRRVASSRVPVPQKTRVVAG